jgi:hypothetical protein
MIQLLQSWCQQWEEDLEARSDEVRSRHSGFVMARVSKAGFRDHRVQQGAAGLLGDWCMRCSNSKLNCACWLMLDVLLLVVR